ncbi:hypothetical protein HWV62_38336 [Athelia sp. TMB]|nr:hypothetical protein HWV62_38336 [Athelia sp. TMB]
MMALARSKSLAVSGMALDETIPACADDVEYRCCAILTILTRAAAIHDGEAIDLPAKHNFDFPRTLPAVLHLLSHRQRQHGERSGDALGAGAWVCSQLYPLPHATGAGRIARWAPARASPVWGTWPRRRRADPGDFRASRERGLDDARPSRGLGAPRRDAATAGLKCIEKVGASVSLCCTCMKDRAIRAHRAELGDSTGEFAVLVGVAEGEQAST